jgi:hypothetical protein
MKTNVFVIFIVIVLSLVGTAKAQDSVLTNKQVAAVTALDNARSPEQWAEVRNHFERLSTVYPTDWLSAYYQAYAGITLFFMSAGNTNYLDDARKCLDKLSNMKQLPSEVISEIKTLNGYWYYAQMSINPAVSGQKYAGVVISSYAEALARNPQNPRAISLNAHFQKSMAAFMNSEYKNFDSDMEKAKSLYQAQDKTTTFPHWFFNVK